MSGTRKRVAAAGGVLWRAGERGRIEVVVVWRPKVGNWSFPKGKLDPGEHPLAGACREVEEETGVPVIPQMWLCRAAYVLPNPSGDVHKTVDFWSMRTEKPDAGFEADDEIGERRWLSLDEARGLLTRPRDRQALHAFAALPPVSGTVLLTARAEIEPDADGPAAARPLSAAGREQAVRLAGLAGLYQPERALGARGRPYARTLEPVAAAARCRTGEDGAFDAEAHGRDPERASARVRELVAGGGCVIVCAEPEVVGDTVAIVADEDGVAAADVATRVGEGWVLSFAGQHLVGLERL